MYVLITYDVNTSTSQGQRRLRKISKCCQNYGQRVQNSVFECLLNEVQYVELKVAINSIIDPALDSVRFYQLGKNFRSKILHIGRITSYEIEGELII